MGSPVLGTPFLYGLAAPMGQWVASPVAWGARPPGAFPVPVWMYTKKVPSDAQIRKLIYDAIKADPTIPPEAEIEVEVKEGVVTLTGSVPNKMVKHAVGDDAWWVPGVWDVHNKVEITPPRGKGTAPTPTAVEAAIKTK